MGRLQMNERIRELAHQADLVIKKSNGNDFRFGAMDPKLEKFAELIVQECIASIPSDGHRGDFGRAVEFCQQQIKQHFGV